MYTFLVLGCFAAPPHFKRPFWCAGPFLGPARTATKTSDIRLRCYENLVETGVLGIQESVRIRESQAKHLAIRHNVCIVCIYCDISCVSLCVGYAWIMDGFRMAHARLMHDLHGLCTDYAWIFQGLCMDYGWIMQR